MSESVVGIIFSQDRSKILIIKRRDVPIWVLPGGGIDPGESAEKAIIREIFEETRLEVATCELVATYEPNGFFTRKTLVYECVSKEGKPQVSDETIEIDFHPCDKLPYPFFPLHETIIDQALTIKDRPFAGKNKKVTLFYIFYLIFKHPILASRFLLARIGFPYNSN